MQNIKQNNTDFKLASASLAWLLISVALVILPHTQRMPVWITSLIYSILAWLWLSQQHHFSPPKSLRLIITLAAVIGIFFSYGTIFGRDPGIALLTLMISLKFLEIRRLRDAQLIIFLSFFLIITNFLHSQSLFMAVYMFFVILVATMTLAKLSAQNSAMRWTDNLRMTTTIIAQAVPLMIILFILFPRVPSPFLGLANGSGQGTTGISDTMTHENISKLIRSNEVAFRVKFKGNIPHPKSRYWRGLVLWQYDGKSWSSGQTIALSDVPKIASVELPVEYEVTMEPSNNRWLFALDIPAEIPSIGFITPAFQLLAREPIKITTRYTMTSYLSYTINSSLYASERDLALQLPAHINPQTRRLASIWRSNGLSDKEIVSKALQMFRDQPFYYTLEPPILGEDPEDDFLFNTRRGFCQHYASAYAFLMRAAGIPARVVIGYQGGEINPLGDYMIVRQSDAHAWVEIWLKDQGWLRVDPTAAVAPERIEQGIDAAIPASERYPALFGSDNKLLKQLGLVWDSLNSHWNQWVLDYNYQRQKSFLSSLGFGDISWSHMAVGLLVLMTTLIALFSITMFRRRIAVKTDPIYDQYNKFCKKLAKIGIVRSANEGPMAFAQRVASLRPDLAGMVGLISRLYINLRYKPIQYIHWRKKFAFLVKRFKPGKQQLN